MFLLFFWEWTCTICGQVWQQMTWPWHMSEPGWPWRKHHLALFSTRYCSCISCWLTRSHRFEQTTVFVAFSLSFFFTFQSILKKTVTMQHTPSAVFHYTDSGGRSDVHPSKVGAIFQAAKKDLLGIIKLQVRICLTQGREEVPEERQDTSWQNRSFYFSATIKSL